jgi:hypothetical protein
LDAQEGSSANLFFPGQPGVDYGLDLGRVPTAEEMTTLAAIAGRHGMYVANTADGVTFLNKNTTVPSGFASEVGAAFPTGRLQQGHAESIYVDLSKELASDNAGQGLATMKVINRLQDLQAASPEMFDALLDSAAIEEKAKANLRRLIQFGGQGQRPDYEKVLEILGEGGLRALWDHVMKNGAQGLAAADPQAPSPGPRERGRPTPQVASVLRA